MVTREALVNQVEFLTTVLYLLYLENGKELFIDMKYLEDTEKPFYFSAEETDEDGKYKLVIVEVEDVPQD